jgi:hypothetical protein
VPYVSTMLWTMGLSIVATILLHIVAAIVSPRDADKKDQRDKQISRMGDYVGMWFVVAVGWRRSSWPWSSWTTSGSPT